MYTLPKKWKEKLNVQPSWCSESRWYWQSAERCRLNARVVAGQSNKISRQKIKQWKIVTTKNKTVKNCQTKKITVKNRKTWWTRCSISKWFVGAGCVQTSRAKSGECSGRPVRRDSTHQSTRVVASKSSVVEATPGDCALQPVSVRHRFDSRSARGL